MRQEQHEAGAARGRKHETGSTKLDIDRGTGLIGAQTADPRGGEPKQQILAWETQNGTQTADACRFCAETTPLHAAGLGMWARCVVLGQGEQ